MNRIDKSVFISYRRIDLSWTSAISQSLTKCGFDVFPDLSRGSTYDDFERVILKNIRTRAHFIVVLTPSALTGCDDPEDWLRREVEEALETRRNIVPLMLEGFNFDTPAITMKLTGKLAELKHYNGMTVSGEYFEESMAKLHQKFLNVPLEVVPHPTSGFAQHAAKDQQAAAAHLVRQNELTAQEWLERGINLINAVNAVNAVNADNEVDWSEAARCFTEAIDLKPDYMEAFSARGFVRKIIGNVDGALKDYSKAILLKPDYAIFHERGHVRADIGDWDGAIQDYTMAIQIKPSDAEAYHRRGLMRIIKSDWDGAIQDYTKVIQLKPDEIEKAFYMRGFARYNNGDWNGAIQDYTEVIRLKPDHEDVYKKRGDVFLAKGDRNAAQRDFDKAKLLSN